MILKIVRDYISYEEEMQELWNDKVCERSGIIRGWNFFMFRMLEQIH
ncbi:MAG: hypothetical protein ACFE8A_12680 [Candidatus Hodarchaeota archaeon]